MPLGGPEDLTRFQDCFTKTNKVSEGNEYPLVSTQENERFEKHLQVQEEVKAAYQKEGAGRTTEENIEKHKKNVAEPFFQLRQKVLAGPEKIKCIVKKMKNDCVLLERSDEDDEKVYQKQWFDISKCSPVLDKDGKPVIEPECKITITFANTKEMRIRRKAKEYKYHLDHQQISKSECARKEKRRAKDFGRDTENWADRNLGTRKELLLKNFPCSLMAAFHLKRNTHAFFFPIAKSCNLKSYMCAHFHQQKQDTSILHGLHGPSVIMTRGQKMEAHRRAPCP